MKPTGVLIPAVLVVAIGGAIGLADWAVRHDRVKLDREAPPPLPPLGESPAKPDGTKPVEPTSQQSQGKPVDTEPKPGPAQHSEPTKPEVKPPTPTAPSQPTETPAAALPEGQITLTQAKALYDQNFFFVDARRKEVYIEGHVANAFRADMASFASGDPQWVSGLPKDMTLVVYCNGGNCDESEHVAQLLNASGFKAVYVMHDGFPGWKAAGYPIETGEGQE